MVNREMAVKIGKINPRLKGEAFKKAVAAAAECDPKSRKGKKY